jgi:predicted ABC-type ATPase
VSIDTPRLRMFAGPNGSGKSTIKSLISPTLLGMYINADELEREIREHGAIDLSAFGVRTSPEEITSFFNASTLLRRASLTAAASTIQLRGTVLDFGDLTANSYFASVVPDFIRRKLISSSISLTFETVMSSPDKVEFFQEARTRGFRTYLYYIATSDPSLNVSRVRNRVEMGGHPVPEDGIISRYYRSLELLAPAIRASDRAYIFDNSTKDRIWLAEITDGSSLEMRAAEMPAWFRDYVWHRMDSQRAE